MSDQPTGVFVRFPLSEGQRKQYLEEINSGEPLEAEASALEAGILAIGMPVSGGDLEPVAYINPRKAASPNVSFRPFHDYQPLVRQSDHQAQISALEAEVVRLREAIHKMIDMSRNAQTWSLNNRAASCRDELSAIGRFGEKTLKGGAA